MSIFLPSGKNHLSGLLKVPDVSPENQILGHKLLWNLLILFMFPDWERKYFGFWQFLLERFPKWFFTCPEKKSCDVDFSRWNSDFEPKKFNIFIGKLFKRFLRLHCKCQVDKFEEKRFLKEKKISFLITWAKSFR